MKKILILGALAVASAMSLRAADMPDGKWWKHPRVSEEIGLTPEQSREIEKIFVAARTRLIDLKADLQKKQLALQVAMEDQAADRKSVEKGIEAVETARGELQKVRALMLLDMKQVLKPEQWERLLQKQREWRENFQQRRRMMRDGERMRPGPEGRRQRGERPSPPPDRP